MFPPEIQYVISNYQVFGLLPLDKILHFFIGAIITVALRILGINPTWTLIIVAIVAMIKEAIDSYTLNNSTTEHIVDILVSVLYPALLLGVSHLKRLAATK